MSLKAVRLRIISDPLSFAGFSKTEQQWEYERFPSYHGDVTISPTKEIITRTVASRDVEIEAVGVTTLSTPPRYFVGLMAKMTPQQLAVELELEPDQARELAQELLKGADNVEKGRTGVTP